MKCLSATDEAVLLDEPWLRPFVEDGDTGLGGARDRYRMAMAAAKCELRGQVLHHRICTAQGYETTALETHPKASP